MTVDPERTRVTPPIELTGHGAHLRPTGATTLPTELLAELAAVCPTVAVGDDPAAVAEASRDWWPLALHWSLAGEAPAVAAALVRPQTTDDVAAVLRLCHRDHVPVTPAGGRSGVCGASVPIHGGVLLDLTDLVGVLDVDVESGIVEVLAGTFGPDLERELARHGQSVGHFPQSFDLATVGGWIACRGAGQYSTRYGKIEDLVVGLEAVLADGTVVRTGGAPAAAGGPDLGQLIIGSEGTLAVVTRAWLRTHPLPPSEQRASYALGSFEAGIEACRQILRRGATPAVLRLYDAAESARGQGGDGSQCVVLVLDEGDELLVAATMAVVADVMERAGAEDLGRERVERWMGHRNDTSGLQALTRKGYVVDTMEIAGPWSRLGEIFDRTREAMLAVPHARAATCHLSHSYPDGACLYFTFAATPPPEEVEATYVALWDAGQRAVLAAGGNLSHHHGVGLNRARFAAEALGSGHALLRTIKDALDPTGILNPGKLGLPSPFGEVPWP